MDTATPARAEAPSFPPPASLRAALKAGREALRDAFLARPDTPKLLGAHARLVDRTIREVWRASGMPSHAALVAVGGYGRGQLYPHSDVDVLILLAAEAGGTGAGDTTAIERFLAALWDVGLEASHAVRTVAQCVSEMAVDATIRTSLLEHRWLAGDRRLCREFGRAWMRQVAENAVLQFGGLLLDRGDDGRVAVAQRRAPPRGNGVHIPAALIVHQMQALAADDHRQVALRGRGGARVGMPHMVAIPGGKSSNRWKSRIAHFTDVGTFSGGTMRKSRVTLCFG